MSDPTKMNADQILAALAAVRAKIPHLEPVPAHDLPPDPPSIAGDGDDLTDFEWESVAIAAQSVADELHAAIEEAEAKALSQALSVYYAAEELARDPAHSDLVPQVEAMRAAYERDYGRAIPPRQEVAKKSTPARRRGVTADE